MKASESQKQHASNPHSSQPFLGSKANSFFSKKEPDPTPFFQPASLPIQTKLTVGAAGDRYEQEADRVAAQVVNQLHSSSTAGQPITGQPIAVQRLGADQTNREMLETPLQRMEEDDEALQMQGDSPSIGHEGGAISHDMESDIRRARGGGQALAPNLQAQMGQAMGADFSGVRVHAGTQADRLSRSIQAKAFTTGQDVFFRQGAYQPQSRSGQELIAHELTHVVQQKSGAGMQRSLFIQADFEDAYINKTAQFHTIDADKDKGTLPNGKKFHVGNEIEVDLTDQKTTRSATGSQTWALAKGGGKQGYIRLEKVTTKAQIQAPDFAGLTADAGKLEQSQGIVDELGGGLGTISGGVEYGAKDSVAVPSTGIAAGAGDTLAGVLGMVASARQISGMEVSWNNLEAGYGFIESTSKSAAGTASIVDSIAKTAGAKDGVGKSAEGASYAGAIASGLSSVKDAASGLIGIYRLFKSQSDQKKKDALVTLKQFTAAASNAASVAKNAYSIIGNAVPIGLIYTVPALSIGVSAIHLLIRTWDALKSGSMKSVFAAKADGLRATIAATFGQADVTSPNIFDKDRRGTFPAYKTYFRTKAAIRDGFETLAKTAVSEQSAIENKHGELTAAEGTLTTATKERDEADQKRQDAADKRSTADQNKSEAETKRATADKMKRDAETKRRQANQKSGVIADAQENKNNQSSGSPLKAELADAYETRTQALSAPAQQAAAAAQQAEAAAAAAETAAKDAEALATTTEHDATDAEALAVGAKDSVSANAAVVTAQQQKDAKEDEVKTAYAPVRAVVSPSGSGDVIDPVKTSLEEIKNTDTLVPNRQPSDIFSPIHAFSQQIQEYEFLDKMAEINQKRQTSGWTDVMLELVSMAGDITTIAVGATGIGAAIGQGVKAGSAAYKVVHGSAKFAQKLTRNHKSDNKKSTATKHKEYVRHTRFIYQQFANLKPTDPPDKAKALKNYIRAAGANYGLWYSLRHKPSRQVEMLVEAMKQR
ncbi:MAG: DUF4157 domain-containing protein [Phormidesmis sp.]